LRHLLVSDRLVNGSSANPLVRSRAIAIAISQPFSLVVGIRQASAARQEMCPAWRNLGCLARSSSQTLPVA